MIIRSGGDDESEFFCESKKVSLCARVSPRSDRFKTRESGARENAERGYKLGLGFVIMHWVHRVGEDRNAPRATDKPDDADGVNFFSWNIAELAGAIEKSVNKSAPAAGKTEAFAQEAAILPACKNDFGDMGFTDVSARFGADCSKGYAEAVRGKEPHRLPRAAYPILALRAKKRDERGIPVANAVAENVQPLSLVVGAYLNARDCTKLRGSGKPQKFRNTPHGVMVRERKQCNSAAFCLPHALGNGKNSVGVSGVNVEVNQSHGGSVRRKA